MELKALICINRNKKKLNEVHVQGKIDLSTSIIPDTTSSLLEDSKYMISINMLTTEIISPHGFYMPDSVDKLSCQPSSYPAGFLQNRKLDLE